MQQSHDLAQMNKSYFQSLGKERLVEVATNLYQLAVGQCERLEQNSSNSSLLSVIETCRLRSINPWRYICEVIARARKGLSPPPIPTG